MRRKLKELVESGTVLSHIMRVFNDKRQEYRWIRVDGSMKLQADGTQHLYGVYSDVSEQVRLEKDLAKINENMEGIINAIPGGVAIYKVTNRFETIYFSEGVPRLTGYCAEEYKTLLQGEAFAMTYWEDTPMVVSKVQDVIRTHQTDSFEFRKLHRNGQIIWVRVQVKWLGEEQGAPLLHCVFHNISDFKETQQALEHLIHSIPGGIASYRVEEGKCKTVFLSNGIVELSGYDRETYLALFQHYALDLIFAPDRKRVYQAAKAMLQNGTVLGISCRIRCQSGQLKWVHLNGRRLGPLTENPRLNVVFTGMSEEARLFQNIANETADGIYVIDQETFDLLYVNESSNLFAHGHDRVGRKCYEALRGNRTPCSFCPLCSATPNRESYDVTVEEHGGFYHTRFRKADWNGIPSYISYVRNVTSEIRTKNEKEKLEAYFQTLVKNLPGGVSVVRYEEDGRLIPEFLSDGFAEMNGLPLDEAWRLYQQDALTGVHPEDQAQVSAQMENFIASGGSHCKLHYRLRKGASTYIWVRNTISLIWSEDGKCRIYCSLQDITREREEQERIRQQYKELILQHYRSPAPNALVIGHCNVSRNHLVEIVDRSGLGLLRTLGTERDTVLQGLASYILDDQERQEFLRLFLNVPSLVSFQRNHAEQTLKCAMQLPGEKIGRFVEIKVNRMEEPDTLDSIEILTVSDITDSIISERIFRRLAITGFDFVVDLDLARDTYTIVSCNENVCSLPPQHGSHSSWTNYVATHIVVPKDRPQYEVAMDAEQMLARLQREGTYSFTFSIQDEQGRIQTKKMVVSPIDLRLRRVCLSRTDITDSVRAQQGMLNMMTYTFERIGFLTIKNGQFTTYTRKTVLENLPPKVVHYNEMIGDFIGRYGLGGDEDEVRKQFSMKTILHRLAEKPTGYDFAFPYREENRVRYKQITVLWSDDSHTTICLVRADVTDMLTAERNAKCALENALALAEEANRAKSDFLSAMSHDIRTPMNAIMGMTTLAATHLDDRQRVKDYLEKITMSSRHLLSLINDILDMSKIERSQVTLTPTKLSLSTLMDQLSAMISPQAQASGVHFQMQLRNIEHENFLGDSLHITQILINILSNAIKFTPEGGHVMFTAEEITTIQKNNGVRYRFVIRDTGIGMTQEFLTQIFEPFARSRTATQIEGTGLGLSITKGLVDLMEGNIIVESEPYRGSTFRVELEFEVASKEETREEFHIDLYGDGLLCNCTFLIAEDNAINAEILIELLKMFGGNSVVKQDGAQAVEEFRNVAPNTYDAILMDIQMPNMNGYEATRAIRALDRPDAQRIPIIAMTANAFSEDVQAALDAGMTAHVAKPIDIDVLRSTLYQTLKRNQEH